MTPEPSSQSLSEVLGELRSLKRPAGLSDESWQQLKSRLAEALRATGKTKFTSAVAPASKSTVADLGVSGDASSATFSWTYRNVADYDQNGEVNVSDLTPLGANLTKTPSAPDWQKAQLADGDNNGEVNIADITPIGANLKNSVNGYKLQFSVDGNDEGTWTEVGSIDTSEGTLPEGGGAKQFQFLRTGLSEGWFRVVPFAGAQTGSPSNKVQLTAGDPTPGVLAGPGGGAQFTNSSTLVGPSTASGSAAHYLAKRYLDPHVTSAGTLVTAGDTGMVSSLDLDGNVLWQRDEGAPVLKVVLADDDSIYGISSRGRLFRLHPDGTPYWEQETGTFGSTIDVFPDGRIVTLANDYVVHSYDTTGNEEWTYSQGGKYLRGPAAAANGSTYVTLLVGNFTDGFTEHKLIAIKPDGSEKWVHDDLPDDNYLGMSEPLAGVDSRALYIGGPAEEELYALNPDDGTIDWDQPGSWSGTFALSPDGHIGIGTAVLVQDQLDVFDKDGANQQAYATSAFGDVWTAPAFGLDGSVYWLDAFLGAAGHHPDGSQWESSTWIGAWGPATGDLDGNMYGARYGAIAKFDQTGTQLWQAGTTGTAAGPAFAADGTAYTVFDGLYAWTSAGTLKWHYDGGQVGQCSAPLIDAQGNVVYMVVDSASPTTTYVITVKPDGSELWTNSYPSTNTYGWPVQGTDGTVYCGFQDMAASHGVIRGFDPSDGSEVYTADMTASFFSSLSIIPDSGSGDVILAPTSGDLFAYDALGAQKWEYPGPNGPASVGSDGTIYLGGSTGLYAVNPNGTERWTYPLATSAGGLAVDPAGGVVFRSGTDITALHADGTLNWTYPVGEYTSNLTLDADDKAYFSTKNTLQCLDSTGSVVFNWPEPGLNQTKPVIGPGGKLYLLLGTGGLLTIAP